MTFLQPFLLAALPLIALPIIIHLINQRRYQTIRWGAMMFLLAANRMSRGYARLRQWLILLFRMLAIAGLIFAISRPLASGWVGLAAGGRADTTMILLDRSPSMTQERRGSVGSKLLTGRQQLVRTLGTLSSARWVLIDSVTLQPREIESPDVLLDLASAEPTSTAADLPALLQATQDYIRTNRPGRTEVWLCSDMRQNDWAPEDGRWQALRDAFLGSPESVRFHLLAYPEVAPDNLSVKVTEVRRRQSGETAELLVSLKLRREDAGGQAPPGKINVPLQIEIEGARSEVAVELAGAEVELKDHRIPLERDHVRGWGKVSIPADSNPSDDQSYFVFDQPVVRRTAVLAEDPLAGRPLQLGAKISPDPAAVCSSEMITPEQLPALEWEKLALLVWQAPLPSGETARTLERFLGNGGVILFLPPRAPTQEKFLGLGWEAWTEHQEPLAVTGWRGDQDLLATTQSGSALPVGQILVKRHAGLAGEQTPLATLRGGAPLLARATTPRGAAYFLTTTPAAADSNLAANGVVLYVLLQRAIGAGAALLGETQILAAGDAGTVNLFKAGSWRQISGSPTTLSTELPYQAGVYGEGERLVAINPLPAEIQAPVLPDQDVRKLFQGLDFARVDDQAGSLAALIQEIWRPFLAAMIVALIAEAVLCLPRLTVAQPAPSGATG